MPIYIFHCEQCGEEIEIIQKIDDPAPVCSQCGQEMKKEISAPNFHLKGDGWYSDLYGRKPKTKEEPTQKYGKTETKTEV